MDDTSYVYVASILFVATDSGKNNSHFLKFKPASWYNNKILRYDTLNN